MVTDWLVQIGAWAVAVLLSPLHLPAVPSWLSGAGATIGQVGQYVEGLGAWIPWPVVIAVLATWVLVLGVSVGIKLVRIALSHIPFIGGNPS